MKFIAALIATAAAVKQDNMQREIEIGLGLPTLTPVARALADTKVADASTIAGIAALAPEEAVDLAHWCMLENACADNFVDIVVGLCYPVDGTDPLPECDAIYDMYDGLADRLELLGYFEGSGFDNGEGSGDFDVDS